MKADVEVNEAFSSLYDEYEKLSRENFIDIARRKTIRDHVERYLKPKSKILEINAGSGIDALYFAQKGHDVLATDISESSESHINSKIDNFKLNNLRFQRCSFTALENIDEQFDCIFSNFGGLNCTNNPEKVFGPFSKLLRPGGLVTLVVMPKYYPWEMLTILKGNKHAFRRWKKDGSPAQIGNQMLQTYYYSPSDMKAAFPKDFRHIATQNIGTFYPSAHFESLQTFENTIRKLVKFDDFINRSWLMPKGIGDYFIITFQKNNLP